MKEKDTSFPFSVTNKLGPVSEMGTPERDGCGMSRDTGTMFTSEREGVAVEATTLPVSN